MSLKNINMLKSFPFIRSLLLVRITPILLISYQFIKPSIDNVALINVDKESYGNVTEVSGT